MTSPPGEDGHARYEEDAAAYALGTLTDAESREFEAHLSRCRTCQALFAEHRTTAGMLALAPAPLTPPPELKRRLMAAVRREAALDRQADRRAGSRRSLAAAGVALPGLAVAAAVVALAVLALSGGNSARVYAGSVDSSGASALVRVSSRRTELDVRNLPTLPPDRLWEVWVQRAGHPPAPANALFGTSDASVTLPADLRGVRAVLVTAEPRPSGSQMPTRPPTVIVRVG